MILLRKVKSPQSAVVLMVQYRRDKCWQEAGVGVVLAKHSVCGGTGVSQWQML